MTRRLVLALGSALALASYGQATDVPASADAVVNSLGMRMVRVPDGTFRMGSPPGEPLRQEEELPRRVTLTRAFRIAATEVTQRQWLALMPANRSPQRGDDLPVTSVSWREAQEFCLKLSQREGATYRLPTEAEWEYACRAGAADPPVGQAELEGRGWYANNSEESDSPRGAEEAERVGPPRHARERGRVDAGCVRPLPARRGGQGTRRGPRQAPRRWFAAAPGAAFHRPCAAPPGPARRSPTSSRTSACVSCR